MPFNHYFIPSCDDCNKLLIGENITMIEEGFIHICRPCYDKRTKTKERRKKLEKLNDRILRLRESIETG